MIKRRLLPDSCGATALEFALCAPAFFMLVMGMVELGLLVWMQVALQQGVEAAARCASINKTTCANGMSAGTYVSVSAARTYSTLISYPGFPASYSQTATSTVRIQ